tara:strand:- start:23 stop:754 length:732 start_codon:yes stop_codon:yes gene_type:complete
MTTQIESLKEENRQFTDKADEQWEKIHDLTEENKALTIKFAQKSRETDTYSSNLSHEMNSLKSKLANRDKKVEELTKQLSEQKPNNIATLKNKIAHLEKEKAERDNADEKKRVEKSFPRYHTVKSYTEEEKMHHFMKFINLNYEWINPSTITVETPRAHIPFEYIIGKIHGISGTKTSGIPKFNMKGPQAHWPDKATMTNYLKTEQKKRYGEHHWKCSEKPDMNAYNGSRKTFAQMRFDLKEK